ncbi:hypothetical protein FRC14_007496, partial [Serendipita sp. 396]
VKAVTSPFTQLTRADSTSTTDDQPRNLELQPLHRLPHRYRNTRTTSMSKNIYMDIPHIV